MKAPGSIDDLVQIRGIAEVRYPKAHRYWDVSGQLIAQLEAALPGLECEGLQPAGFTFKASAASTGLGLKAANYYWNRATVEPEFTVSPRRFEDAAARFFEVVYTALEVPKFSRVGYRCAFLFPTATPKDFLDGLDLFDPRPVLAGFGKPTTDGVVLRSKLPLSGDTRVRLEINAGQGAVNGKERDGVLLDVDFSRLDVTSADLHMGDFIREDNRLVRDKLHFLLRG